MKISDVMHKGLESVSPDTSVAAIAKKMRDKDVGALPVTKNGMLVGIITDRDLVVRALADGRDPTALTAGDVMTSPVVTCRDTDQADHAVEVMETRQIRRLPVLDRNDRLVGIVTLGDISHLMPQDIAAEVLQSVSAHHP